MNTETDNAPLFFEARGMTRLWTDPTFNEVRNNQPKFKDQVYFKGLNLELIFQVPRRRIGSDHDGLLIKVKNGKPVTF